MNFHKPVGATRVELYGPGYSALERDNVSTTTLQSEGLQGPEVAHKENLQNLQTGSKTS